MVIMKIFVETVPLWINAVLTIPLVGMCIGGFNLVAFFRWNNKQ